MKKECIEIYNQLEKDIKAIIYDSLIKYFEGNEDAVQEKISNITYLLKASPVQIYKQLLNQRIVNLVMQAQNKKISISEAMEYYKAVANDEKVVYYQKQLEKAEIAFGKSDLSEKKQKLVSGYHEIVCDIIEKTIGHKMAEDKKYIIDDIFDTNTNFEVLDFLDGALEEIYGSIFSNIDDITYTEIDAEVEKVLSQFKKDLKEIYKQDDEQYKILSSKIDSKKLTKYEEIKIKNSVLNSLVLDSKEAWSEISREGGNFVFTSGDEDIGVYLADLVHETLHSFSTLIPLGDETLIGFRKINKSNCENANFEECVVEYMTQWILKRNPRSDIYVNREFSNYDPMILMILQFLKKNEGLLKEYMISDDSKKLENLIEKLGKADFTKMSTALDEFYKIYSVFPDATTLDVVDEIINTGEYAVIKEVLPRAKQQSIRSLFLNMLEIREAVANIEKNQNKEIM